jgi:hypothetical protein
MPIYLNMVHSPEMCPIYNDKVRKKYEQSS